MKRLTASRALSKTKEFFNNNRFGTPSPQKAEKGMIMKTFYIAITETLKKTVEVRAEDKYEAIQKVSDAYHDEQVVLDSDDYVDVDFDDVTDDTIYNYELGGMPKFYEVQ